MVEITIIRVFFVSLPRQNLFNDEGKENFIHYSGSY